MIHMAVSNKAFRLVPYRDTAARIATEQDAESAVIDTFLSRKLGEAPRVRSGYWYDIQKAGGTAYNGSNALTFATSSNAYGFPDAVVLSFNIPQAQAWAIYGIADYTANPSLQAVQITMGDVNYPIIYLSPDIYTNEDHKVILNGTLPAQGPNRHIDIALFGISTGTDNIDILFKIAEPAAEP